MKPSLTLLAAAALAMGPALAQQPVYPIIEPPPVPVYPILEDAPIDAVPVHAPRPASAHVPAHAMAVVPGHPVIVRQSMPALDPSDYRIDFDSLDANGDGALARREVASPGNACACSPKARANLQREFHVADANNDGRIQRHEAPDWLD